VYEITGSPDYVYALASQDNEMQLLYARNLEKIVRASKVNLTLTPELSAELGVLSVEMAPKSNQRRNSDSSVPVEDAITELMNISSFRSLHREREKIDALKKILLTLQGRVDVASSLVGTRKLCSIENPENMVSISSVAYNILFFLEEWVKYNENALTLGVRVLGLDILEQLRCLSNKAENEQRFYSTLFSNIGFSSERKAKIVHDQTFDAIFRQCTKEQFKAIFPNQPEDTFIYDGQITQMKAAFERGESEVEESMLDETLKQKRDHKIASNAEQTSASPSYATTNYSSNNNRGYGQKSQFPLSSRPNHYELQSRPAIQPQNRVTPVASQAHNNHKRPGAYDAYKVISHTPYRTPYHHTNNIHGHGRKR